MKFIKVKFSPDSVEYTYACDDDTVQPGDLVQVTTPRGSIRELLVQSLEPQQPPFACKPAMKVG